MLKEKVTSVAKVDSKRRIALPATGEVAEYYAVLQQANGDIILRPRIIADPREMVSIRTLEVMDRAVAHLSKGEAGKPIDLSQFLSNEDHGEE